MPEPVVSRFVDYLNASPTSYHAVQAAAERLEDHGFQQVSAGDPPRPLPAGFRGYVRDAGSLFAFRVGRQPAVESGWRIVAGHTDSPHLRLKPQPLVRGHGYVRLGVEVYGGVQIATWADRDLGLAGVVHLREGDGVRTELVHLRRPLCRVPTLAIHLNRKVNEEGLKLNAQTQLPAVLALETDDTDPLRTLLAAELDRAPGDILTWDLALFDLAPSGVLGANEEFVSSGRLDNLGSCHAGLEALIASLEGDDPGPTSVLALFDHEEIGSRTSRGASGRVLDNVLRRTLRDAEPQGAGTFSRALAHSFLLSADMAHAVHPGFADKHDAEHMPKINAGPVIKQNANHRYSTEGQTSAAFLLLCERAEVPVQWFVNRSDLACGSTVGPMLTARLGIRGLDVGNPMLSMHSARETCGTKDHGWMVRAMTRFFSDPL